MTIHVTYSQVNQTALAAKVSVSSNTARETRDTT